MKSFVATMLLSLCVSTTSLAGGGDWDSPQQMAIPQSQVVLVSDKEGDNNTALWIALVGAMATMGAAFITVRYTKK